MKVLTALLGACLLAQGVGVFAADLTSPSQSDGAAGKVALAAQAGAAQLGNRDYDATFGENWESVRIFRLMTPLQAPLKVYVETHAQPRGLYKRDYRDYVVRSLNAWTDALDGRLSFELTNRRKGADITVDWTAGFDEPYVAGVTTYSVGRASVEIKTVNVPEKDIYANILHELGHALGISGHSSQQGDIMVGMRRWHRDNTPYEPRLSARDIQAIRRLYSLSWRKGEDLYATTPQNAALVVAQQPPASLSTQSAQRNVRQQYKFTQIFPSRR